MFPPLPHFEDFRIRLQVTWYDQKHSVEVRFGRWPESHSAVLVCRFEDEPEHGEWIVLGPGITPYTIGNPRKLLFYRHSFDVPSKQPRATLDLRDDSLKKLKRIVQSAFEGDNFSIGRVLLVPGLPDEPRLVLWSPVYSLWNKSWNFREQTATCFEWRPSPHYLNAEQMVETLTCRWNQPDSEARFAWEWFRWSSEERMCRFTGFSGESVELTQVMTWILIVTRRLWELDEGWYWDWRGGIEDPLPQFSSSNHAYDWQIRQTVEEEKLFGKWEQMLLSHFFPALRHDWFKKHQCVRLYWWGTIAEVSLNSPPTMHEQLEARLSLREWLETNAPDRMDLLVS